MSSCRKPIVACVLALGISALPCGAIASVADDAMPEAVIEEQSQTEDVADADVEAYELDADQDGEPMAQSLDCNSAISAGLGGFMQSVASSSSATSAQKQSAALAVKMLNGTSGAYRGSSPAGWYSNYVSTDGWNSKNALSLVQLKNATTYMETVNNLRKSEGLPELKIDLVSMAGASLNTCYSSNVWGHASNSGSGSYMISSEILAMRYGEYTGSSEASKVGWPFSGWYTSEKKIFDAYVQQYGSSLESLRHNGWGVYVKYPAIYSQCGHYLNIVDSYAKAFGVGTGMGKGAKSGVTIVDFTSYADSGQYFTVAEFKKLVNNYVDPLLQTMTRLYNPYSGEHLYTSSSAEIQKCVSLGWKNEGTAWIAPKQSDTPVYRLYNKYTGDHHYTTSKSEYDKCEKAGWTKEGIAWYSGDSTKGAPLYRGYNPYVTIGTHHYTTNWDEMTTMKKNGWKYEGTAWYGLK